MGYRKGSIDHHVAMRRAAAARAAEAAKKCKASGDFPGLMDAAEEWRKHTSEARQESAPAYLYWKGRYLDARQKHALGMVCMSCGEPCVDEMDWDQKHKRFT